MNILSTNLTLILITLTFCVKCAYSHDSSFSSINYHISAQKKQFEAIFLSCNSSQIEQINAMLQKNINVNCTDKYGNTALHLAAYRRESNEFLYALIGIGINPRKQNKYGLTYQDIQFRNQQTGCFNLDSL